METNTTSDIDMNNNDNEQKKARKPTRTKDNEQTAANKRDCANEH